jgi:EpsI family protein
MDRATMNVLGVDDYVLRAYSSGDQIVGLYVGYYRSQRQGDTIHSPMNCLPGAGWVPVQAGRMRIPTTGGGEVEVNRYLIQKGEERQVALYWYEGRGRTVASEYWSKAYLVWDAASRNRTDGALVRVLSPVARGEDADAAARRAEAFTARLLPLLPAYVPR